MIKESVSLIWLNTLFMVLDDLLSSFMQSVSISDKIFSSDFHKLDKRLQRDLILMIQMSHQARVVKGSKFFVFKLSGYTKVYFITLQEFLINF